jgi:MFS family permease
MLSGGLLAGQAADRVSFPLVVAIGAALIGIGFLTSSFSTAIWQLFLLYGFVLGLGQACCFIPAVSAIGQWFLKHRGFATGLAVSGSGIGTVRVVSIFQEMKCIR